MKPEIDPNAVLPDKLHGQGLDGLVDDAVARYSAGERKAGFAAREATPGTTRVETCHGDDGAYRSLRGR